MNIRSQNNSYIQYIPGMSAAQYGRTSRIPSAVARGGGDVPVPDGSPAEHTPSAVGCPGPGRVTPLSSVLLSLPLSRPVLGSVGGERPTSSVTPAPAPAPLGGSQRPARRKINAAPIRQSGPPRSLGGDRGAGAAPGLKTETAQFRPAVYRNSVCPVHRDYLPHIGRFVPNPLYAVPMNPGYLRFRQ